MKSFSKLANVGEESMKLRQSSLTGMGMKRWRIEGQMTRDLN